MAGCLAADAVATNFHNYLSFNVLPNQSCAVFPLMAIRQLYLKGFSHHLFGSAPRSCANSLIEASNDIDGISRLAGHFFPASLLAGSNCVFSTLVTFWAFLCQVLTRDASCRAALANVQARRASQGKSCPSQSTGAYCLARKRLPLNTLRAIFEAVGAWIARRHEGSLPLLAGRVVRVLDGTGISMPDSPKNRAKWSYPGNQKPGCGFPAIKLVALFCLGTGRMIKFAFDEWKQSEFNLARQVPGWLNKADVVLTDCGFCSWALIAAFLEKQIDVVMRLHQARKDKAGTSVWKKPQRTKSWSKQEWNALPPKLVMRIIEFRVLIPGFRTERITLCTTLLDTEKYSDEAIIELYMKRWNVELYIRNIKVTLGLDVVRCMSPEMVEKEIWMQAIAHNMVRALMVEAAMTHGVALERLSFKGTVDRMRKWSGWMNHAKPRTNKTLLAELLRLIASDQVPLRPYRVEPRAVKRRPKSYQWLTKPRHEMVVSHSRRKKK